MQETLIYDTIYHEIPFQHRSGTSKSSLVSFCASWTQATIKEILPGSRCPGFGFGTRCTTCFKPERRVDRVARGGTCPKGKGEVKQRGNATVFNTRYGHIMTYTIKFKIQWTASCTRGKSNYPNKLSTGQRRASLKIRNKLYKWH